MIEYESLTAIVRQFRSNLSLHRSTRVSIDFFPGFGILTSHMPLVKCPYCGKEVEFSGNEFRPFCSERCKLLDFGEWADGNYSLPAEAADLSDDDINATE